MTKTSLRLILFISIAATTGCSKKRLDVKKHDPALQVEAYQAPDDKSVGAKQVEALDVKDITDKTKAASTAQALYSQVITPLRAVILNANVVENPNLNDRDNFLRSLGAFNAAIIKALKLDPKFAEHTQLIDDYYRTVSAGCLDDMSECRNIRIFASDPDSRTIVFEKIKQLTKPLKLNCATDACFADTGSFLKSLAVALKLTRVSRDPQIEILYLEWARQIDQYIRWILNTNTTNYSDAAIARHNRMRMQLDIHWRIFSRLIIDFSNNTLPQPIQERMAKFLDTFSDLAIMGTLEELNDQSNDELKRALELVRADYYKNRALSKGRITKAAQTKLNALENVASKTKPSYRLIVNELSAKYPQIFFNLGLQDASSLSVDEYYLLCAQLLRGLISQDTAADLWRQILATTPIDVAQTNLFRAMEYFVKVNLAYELIATNEYFRDHFNNPDNRRSTSLFTDALASSRRRTHSWHQLVKVRLQRFADFNKRSISPLYSRQSDLSEAAKQARTMDEMLSGIPRNIKYLGVYNNMMMLSYFMSKQGGVIRLFIWFIGRYVEIPAEFIIKTVFLFDWKELESYWFDFANEEGPMNKLEILISYFMGLKAEVFESYRGVAMPDQDNNSVLFTESDFFKEIMKNLLSDVNTLEAKTDELNQQILASSNFNSFISRACKNSDQPVEIEFFKGADESLLLQTNIPLSSGLAMQAMKAYSEGLAKNIRSTVNNLVYNMNYLQAMVDLYEVKIQADGASPSVKRHQGELALIRSELNSYRARVNRYFETVLKLHALTDDCIMNVTQYEADRLYAVTHLEADYFKDVHAAMALLQMAQIAGSMDELVKFFERKSTSETLKQYWNQLAQANPQADPQADPTTNPFADLSQRLSKIFTETRSANALELEQKLNARFDIQDPEITTKEGASFPGHDRFDANNYYMWKFDFLARLRRHLRDPSVKASNTKMKLGTNWRLDDLYAKPGQGVPVTFQLNQQTFLAQTLIVANGKSGSFTKWWTGLADSSLGTARVAEHLSVSAALFRLGRIAISEETCNAIESRQQTAVRISTTRIGPRRVGTCYAEVSSDALVDEAVNFARRFRLNANDRKFMPLVGRNNKYDDIDLGGVILNKNTYVPIPALEFLYKDYLTADYAEIQETESYFVNLKNLGVMIFPIGEKAERAIRNVFRPIGLHFLVRMNQLEHSIAKFEKAHPEFTEDCTYGLNPDGTDRSCVYARESGQRFASVFKGTSESYQRRIEELFKKSACQVFAVDGNEYHFGLPLASARPKHQSCESFVEEKFKL